MGGLTEQLLFPRSISAAAVTTRVAQSRGKRVADIVAATLGLVLLAPVFALISLAVVVDSGRPIFFDQTRVGLGGGWFKMWKFRTMVRDAEALRPTLESLNEAPFPTFKLARDPRVTRIGRALRRSSLDELPQLLNVLRGEMSLVGPRPPLPSEVEHYSRSALHRLDARPGLTCYWQIEHRHSGEMTFAEWLALDVRYIESWSYAVDCRLIVKTLGTIVSMSGS